jgi:hypothetical protein
MHHIRPMRETSQQAGSGSEPAPEPPPREARDDDRESSLVRFGRRHPTLTVIGLAGAGLLGGLEVAAGVLLGAGVAMLIRRADANKDGTTASPAATRGRMRKILARAPRGLDELRARARAVMRAASGEIGSPPEAQRGDQARPSEPDATQASRV